MEIISLLEQLAGVAECNPKEFKKIMQNFPETLKKNYLENSTEQMRTYLANTTSFADATVIVHSI